MECKKYKVGKFIVCKIYINSKSHKDKWQIIDNWISLKASKDDWAIDLCMQIHHSSEAGGEDRKWENLQAT